jgi:hypothetical protein
VAVFEKLLAWRRTTGFIELVRPLTFAEEVERSRRIRDLGDGLVEVLPAVHRIETPAPEAPMQARTQDA